MAKPNIYDLEKFFYDNIKIAIRTQLSIWDVYNNFGSPNGLTIRELFKEHLELEAQGKRYRFNIRRVIYPGYLKYNSIYQAARTKAYIEFCQTLRYHY